MSAEDNLHTNKDLIPNLEDYQGIVDEDKMVRNNAKT